MTLDGLPTLSGLEDLLSHYANSSAYVIEIADEDGKPFGNNGDFLMDRVFQRILTHVGIRVTAEPREASILIVPPSGALLEVYAFPALLRRRLRQLPDLPLLIFPSSAYFPREDPASIFGSRKATTLWILRERHSLDHLSNSWGGSLARVHVDLALDHDVVASGHVYVPDIVGEPVTRKHPLVAARVDREKQSLDRAGAQNDVPTRSRLLTRIRQPLDDLPRNEVVTAGIRLARSRRSRRAAESLVAGLPPSTQEQILRQARVVDISATQFATFRLYAQYIREASMVVTNRLHVALPAAVLGKQVIIVSSGYHKIRGVYEQSLAGMGTVDFLHAPTQSAID